MSDLCPPAGFGRKDVVDHLLRTGANVHARDDGGLIPLHNACSFGHSEVRLLPTEGHQFSGSNTTDVTLDLPHSLLKMVF